MVNQLRIFQHDDFGRLEIYVIDGKVHFPATECAKILGYTNPHKAVRDHCRYRTKREVPHPQSPGKYITVNIIPEGDLYRLIIRSRLPAAEEFERWVFDKVLPCIRKHGMYAHDELLDEALADPELAFQLFQDLEAERRFNSSLRDRVSELAPKARYCDVILQSRNAVPVTQIAKDYDMSAIAFNRLLHRIGVQYKVGGTWFLYQQYSGQGYTKSRTYYCGEGVAAITTHWTQKGRQFLYEKLARYGVLPSIERPDR